jgi:hypothetical protein
MQTNLRIKNIVFVGNFNLSTFDKYFFIKHNIVKEDELLPFTRFDSGAIQVSTHKFDIIVVPQQLIFSSKIFNQDTDELNKIAALVIKTGNVIDINAFGINFHWFMEDETRPLNKLSRDLFYNDKIKLFSDFFDDENAVFGIYASKNFKTGRLKLDIKPGKFQEIAPPYLNPEVITFAFNFHFDIKNLTDNSEIINILNEYDSYKKESERIISTYN